MGKTDMDAGDRPEMQCGGDLLVRLARDRRGNVLAIVGASLVPLIAMIGSGVDLSRTYMAHTRLQQACDAGALAGRRAMTDGTVDDNVRKEANKFFNFNFPIGTKDVDGTAWFGARGFEPTIGSAADNTVTVSASTVMPTTIMKMFGYATLPISVNCNARIDYVNTDIVLVLDTTGSMKDKATSTDTDTKIVALRKAVKDFYKILQPTKTQLETVGLRMRVSVVPYASSINVGKVLRGVNTDYVAKDKWTYQSRVARYRHISKDRTSAQCDTDSTGTTPTKTDKTGNGENAKYTCTWVNENTGGGSYSNDVWGWNYRPLELDISNYVTGNNQQTTPTRVPGSNTKSAVWAGCIEERQSTPFAATDTAIPADAWDLDVDRMAALSDIRTQWKPYWPEVSYERFYPVLDKSNVDSSQWYLLSNDTLMRPQTACPTEAKRLQVWTEDALSTYLETLNPDGGTYHDNGMIWGIRMLSGTGVFSADNPDTYKGTKVAKYLIFMTDGAFDTGYDTLYTTYGVEKWDKRVGGTDEATQLERHVNRFNLLCKLARGRGIDTWVVAFDQALTDSLEKCAKNKNQASTSANSAQLNARFKQIAQNIGALRLTQ